MKHQSVSQNGKVGGTEGTLAKGFGHIEGLNLGSNLVDNKHKLWLSHPIQSHDYGKKARGYIVFWLFFSIEALLRPKK